MGIADRLRYARERAGLTGAQVKAKTGIGGSSVSEFEHGKREPRLSQLQALARAYQRSLAFFLAEGPIPQEMVLWRERPAEDAETVQARFLRLCEQYHNLEIWCGERARARLPEVRGDPDTFDFTDAEELAKRVRRELDLGPRPGRVLLSVLEEVCGVKIFHLPFQPSGPAASTVSETFGPAVLLNARTARWRRNDDLARELFHLVTWAVFRPSGGTSPGEREEQLAQCFANHLLLPPEGIETALRARVRDDPITYEALFDIAREFDASVEALIWRLRYPHLDAGGLKQVEAETRHARRLAPFLEHRESAAAPLYPPRYRALAVQALRRGEFSIARFADYLDLTRQQAMRYVEQETPHREDVQLAPG